MSYAALIAIALTAVCIAVLCFGDPKRRRASGEQRGAQGVRVRRLFVSLACLPGVVLALSGDVAAFLIWLGGCGVVGWLVALTVARNNGSPAPR